MLVNISRSKKKNFLQTRKKEVFMFFFFLQTGTRDRGRKSARSARPAPADRSSWTRWCGPAARWCRARAWADGPCTGWWPPWVRRSSCTRPCNRTANACAASSVTGWPPPARTTWRRFSRTWPLVRRPVKSERFARTSSNDMGRRGEGGGRHRFSNKKTKTYFGNNNNEKSIVFKK